MTLISFKINDFQYTIDNKLTLIQAALKNKIDIPRFCFHEKLAIAGNCRMCLVEDLKQVKPLASCAINVTNSMTIYTNTVKVKKARESVLEFLLANHPLDCPICDQGGECDLQDQSLVFGSDRGRFYEFKRSVEDKDCGPLIKTIMNRCIHCTRCVRFSNEVAGSSILGVTGRGSKMEIGFYVENLMRNELSGNIIDLCPVGALTSKPFAFTSRPWELKSYNTIDILDSMHSNIRIDVRGTKIMRILPRVNEKINEDWITDRIRFSYDSFRRQRLFDPMLMVNGNFLKFSWKAAFSFLKNFFFKLITKNNLYSLPIKNCFGTFCDIETIFMLKRIMSITGSPHFAAPILDKRISYSFNMPLDSISSADFLLLLGLNLRVSLPILNSRIRKAYTKKSIYIYNVGYYSNFTFFVKHISTNYKSVLNVFEGSHWLSSKLSKSSSYKPLFLINSDIFKHNFDLISNYTNLISSGWIGVNYLSDFHSYGSKELNFLGSAQSYSLLDNNYSINYLVNYDDKNKLLNSKKNFTIYQGHHGDISAINSNLIFPSTSFIEKNSLYLNFLGTVQKTKKVLFNVGNSRDDWKIINAIIHFLGFDYFKLSTTFDIISSISKTTPFILYKNSKINFNLFSGKSKTTVFYYNNIKSVLNNFYLNNSITRNSKIMSLSYSRFKSRNYNFF
jgi:NADH-quinone oxidoreductase chain G